MAKQLVRTTTSPITSQSPNIYVGYGLYELPIQTVVQDRTAFNSMANCVYEESQLNVCWPSQVSNEAFFWEVYDERIIRLQMPYKKKTKS